MCEKMNDKYCKICKMKRTFVKTVNPSGYAVCNCCDFRTKIENLNSQPRKIPIITSYKEIPQNMDFRYYKQTKL